MSDERASSGVSSWLFRERENEDESEVQHDSEQDTTIPERRHHRRMNDYLRAMASKATAAGRPRLFAPPMTWFARQEGSNDPPPHPPSYSEYGETDRHSEQQQRTSLLSHNNNGGIGPSNSFDHEDNLLDDDLGISLLHPSQQQQSQPHWRQSFRFQFQRPFLHPDNPRAVIRFLRRLGDYLAYFTLLTMLMVLPLVLYRALRNRKVDLAAWNSAGVMACGTVILSFRQVYLHLSHWYMPQVQKYVVRILWMVPIYSIQSWLSLRFHTSRIYIDTIRDLYEAYVIASFVYYLIELLGGQDALIHVLLQKRETAPTLGQHPFPLRLLLQRWELGVDFMLQCKHGVLQYVVFKIVSTILTYFFEMTGMYCEGTFSWKVAYPYLCFFQNISVMYALYSLVMLYSAVKEELEYPVDWKPLYKFLCIKGVVFFTWWQGVIIFYLRAHGIIGNVGNWSSRDVAYGLIDYCIVIEMVGFAIAHSYTFTYKEYLPDHLRTIVSTLDPEANDDERALRCGPAEDNDDAHHLNTAAISSEPNNSRHSSHHNSSSCNNRSSSYRPPTTLDQPMKFREALWSSTLPSETIQDIQRLRAGIDIARHEVLSGRMEGDCTTAREISLPEIDASDLHLREEEVVHILEDGGDDGVVDGHFHTLSPNQAEEEDVVFTASSESPSDPSLFQRQPPSDSEPPSDV